MRKYKKGEKIFVELPDESRVQATILRVSPDGENVIVRIDDSIEMLTETRFLRDKASLPHFETVL